ncbi:histidine phosphatase family protein [Streptomyces pactum]|uniref:histidine phosphatase family protein n=1 Tax=Streptomyces pactum TaxID=68249 RepID=UPI0027DD8A2D|nr:histidine phosphatase family protein [Streptomyces pactum]
MTEPSSAAERGEPPVHRHRLGGLTAVRHAESVANERFAAAARGATDRHRPPDRESDAQVPLWEADALVPLSDRGVRQAVTLGAWLAALLPAHRPDLVLCSPYRRARQTWSVMAREAARRGHPAARPLFDARLRDREMGVFELLTPAAIAAAAPEEARRRARTGEWFYRPPGGESHADVALRVGDLLTRLDAVAGGARVLVVAHDAVVTALRHVLDGIGAPVPEDLPPVPNASVTRWVADRGRLRLEVFGDTGHLGDTGHPGGTGHPGDTGRPGGDG